jgi:mono/diheme cytochrome c family protein
MLSPTQLAQVAYRAYGETTHFTNFRGEPMPDWAELGDRIQRAWVAAVAAVAEQVRGEES